MTRYEHGFIQKCAEYGVDGRALLEKIAERNHGEGAKLGAKLGLLGGSLAGIPNALNFALLSGRHSPKTRALLALLGFGSMALPATIGGAAIGGAVGKGTK